LVRINELQADATAFVNVLVDEALRPLPILGAALEKSVDLDVFVQSLEQVGGLARQAEALVAGQVDASAVPAGQRLKDNDDAGEEQDHHQHVCAVAGRPFFAEKRDRLAVKKNENGQGQTAGDEKAGHDHAVRGMNRIQYGAHGDRYESHKAGYAGDFISIHC
jgi:hypothetical protein